MTEPHERSQSMAAYASTHAEPDPETSARLRERLKVSMAAREGKKQRARVWLQALLGSLALCAVLGVVAWQLGWLAPSDADDHRGVISTAAQGQDIALPGAHVSLGPHTLVRAIEERDALVIELVDGDIEVVADGDPARVRVRVGPYELDSESPRFSVHRGPGVPLVTVHQGKVSLRGPDLPSAGVVMSAPSG
jgi:ferric-dicitrate binding protein FerR (iron transport regulator)